MKIHYITVPMPHHASHSGYGRMLDFIPHTPLPLSSKVRDLPIEELQNRFAQAKAFISWYEMNDLESEAHVNALSPLINRHVVHYLYGENSWYHTQKTSSNLKRIFVTFHQPPQYHAQFVRSREPLKNIDGIIVVGSNQTPFFSQFVDSSKIFFVPHGVDIDFFKPPADENLREKKKCLFVGNWIRDFETLVKTSRLLQEADPEISIDVLTLEKNRFYFEGLKNINFKCGIPESELLAKYQHSTILLLPLKDCTANNTIIEAMACGLPVITTEIGGIRDYVDDNCASLCQPGNARQLADNVLHLLSNHDLRREMGTSGRHRALKFDWRNIASLLTSIYKQSFKEKVPTHIRYNSLFSSYTEKLPSEEIEYEAEVKLTDFPTSGTIGETLKISVAIRNMSTTTWPAHIKKAVRCCYHIYNEEQTLLLWDGIRCELPHDVAPGTEINLTVKAEAPSEPGTYKIAIDLVQEQVAWFSSKDLVMPSFKISIT